MKTLNKISELASKYFSLIVVITAAISIFTPSSFTWVVPNISLMLGIIMFGMGMTIEMDDFKTIISRPKDILIGVLAQYTIMPLAAFLVSKLFRLPPEIAIGVILVGTCPGGTASNVITFLANGDVALSVAMTTASTLLAPFLTPVITKLLAGVSVEVSIAAMFMSILKVVLIPVILGLVVNQLFGEKVKKVTVVLPLVSVITIALTVGGVVSVNVEDLLTSGLLILGAVIVHNGLGLFCGYMVGKALGLEEKKRRTLSIEVGLQNSGLATQLAMAHFTPIAAIAGGIFSVWHNISGPILATYWKQKDEKSNKEKIESCKNI